MLKKYFLHGPVPCAKCFQYAYHPDSLQDQNNKAGNKINDSYGDHKTDEHISCYILHSQPVKNIRIKIPDRFCIPCGWEFFDVVINIVRDLFHLVIVFKKNFITTNLIGLPSV